MIVPWTQVQNNLVQLILFAKLQFFEGITVLGFANIEDEVGKFICDVFYDDILVRSYFGYIEYLCIAWATDYFWVLEILFELRSWLYVAGEKL